MEKLLEIQDVSFVYQTKTDEISAVKNLSFSCSSGEFVCIIGPSGCGKTTVLSLIAGLISPTKGKILVEGKSVKSNNLGYMLQKDQLLEWRTIEKNVFLPLEIKGLNDAKHKDYARSLLDKYGLKDFKKNYPSQLSGGMRQRAALIRTLVSNPKLLLLDEPFSALDFQTRLSVCDDVYGIIKQEKKTAVLVTHDISEAISMADVIVVLSKRPATVRSVFRPQILGDSPLKKRENKQFSVWFEKIHKELNS